MAATHSSLELLAHFDGPVTQETTFRAPTAVAVVPPRGVGWVLQWSAAIATLLFAGVMLVQFACCLAAERTLARAARAGALEATLPCATYQSVSQAVERRLSKYRPNRLRFSLHQNGAPVRGVIQARDGDRLVVALALPTHEILPRWLSSVSFWQGESQIAVQAERRLPSRLFGEGLPTSPRRGTEGLIPHAF